MPPDFDDRTDLIEHLTSEEGHDHQGAEVIADAIESEREADHGDVGELWDAIQNASGMIVDAAVELNSAVDVPAIESRWVMFKSANEDYNRQIDTRLVFKQDSESEKRISYAPAMIPRTPDKEGEVVPTAVVENSAHGYLKEGGGIDTDHNLIEGKGEVVESWIEPTDREWDLPDGGTESYPAGTWMLGVEWGQEAWERIQGGELTGLSIYGMAEQLELQRAARNTAEDAGEPGRTTKSDSAKTDEREPTMGDETPADDSPPLTEEDVRETMKDVLSERDAEQAERDRDIGDVIESVVSELADHDEVGMAAEDLHEAIRSIVANEDMPDEDDEDEEDEDGDDTINITNDSDVSKDALVEWASEAFGVEADAAEKALDDAGLDISRDAGEFDLGSVHRFIDAVGDGVTAGDTAAALSVLSGEGAGDVARSVSGARWRKNFEGEESARSTAVGERQRPTIGGVPSYEQAAAEEAENR